MSLQYTCCGGHEFQEADTSPLFDHLCCLRFDAHVHLAGLSPAPALALRQAGICGALNIAYSSLGMPQEVDSYEGELRRAADASPGFYSLATTFGLGDFAVPAFANRVIARLEQAFRNDDVRAVKIWKDLGMLLANQDGTLVPCDDHRFDPIFEWLNARKAVVIVHAADPIDGWLPPDTSSLHYKYFAAYPQFSFFGKPGKPSHAELMRGRDRLVERWSDIRFIGAHVASLAHDISAVAAFLETHANAWIDIAARQADLMLRPDKEVRELFLRFPDRILYGSDFSGFGAAPHSPDELVKKIERQVRQTVWGYRYFEETLALPKAVLERFYYTNAAELFQLPPHAGC